MRLLYVNSKIQDDSELGKLMKDLACTNADEVQNKVLANRVRYLKEEAVVPMSMLTIMAKVEEKESVN